MTSRFGGVSLGQPVAPVTTAQLGISVEPLAVLQGMSAPAETEARYGKYKFNLPNSNESNSNV